MCIPYLKKLKYLNLFNFLNLKVILLPLELRGGVDLAGADLLDGHLDVVHPLHHLGVPGVVHLLDEPVVLLPERHPQA